MRVEVQLEAHSLWDMIIGTETKRNKDHLALFVILSSISKSHSLQRDIKELANENLNIPRVLHVGDDHVVQSWIWGLLCEFENLTMKKEKTVIDFFVKFPKAIYKLRDLKEWLEEEEVVPKVQSIPVKYVSLAFLLAIS